MTLTSSGTLTYNTIRAEFGSSSSNVQLSLYVRGGQYTPSVPQNANITTSATGEIAVNDFYGAAGNTDYAWGTGGSHNTGGKDPLQYYGIGGPSLPASFNSGSLKVGSATTTISEYYHQSGGFTSGFFMQFANSNGHQNSNWTSRTFYAYNLATSQVWFATTSDKAGTSTNGSQPGSNGSYNLLADALTFDGTNYASGADSGGSASALGAYFSIKAS